MKNIDKVKDWILSHPEWKYSPRDEHEKERLRNGDEYFVWNVYMTNEDKRKTLIKGIFDSGNRCRLCWRYPDYSDSMCIHYDCRLNYCHGNTIQWLSMDESQGIPEEFKQQMNEEMEEDIKYRKIFFNPNKGQENE